MRTDVFACGRGRRHMGGAEKVKKGDEKPKMGEKLRGPSSFPKHLLSFCDKSSMFPHTLNSLTPKSVAKTVLFK